ncbi:hypothetical protein [Modestobacter italicus]|uniref:hypothetical protein n=1 Tax=Modestobacter italicus (strain DSM 44449 / CECT 9708 / BC 501) TaxID=2732864 RepID=UPI001C985F73|nr:hypothetical protein [Modestobacter italicus]
MNTALAIVRSSGTVQIVTGAIVLAVPFLATGLNNAIAIWAGSDSKFNRYERRRLWWFYGLSLFYLSQVLPWTLTALLLLFSVFYVFRWVRRRRKVELDLLPATTEAAPRFNRQQFLDTPPEDAQLRRLWSEYKLTYAYLKQPPSAHTDPKTHAEESANLTRLADEYNARVEAIQAAGRPTIDAAAIALLATVLLPVVQQSINDKVWLPAEVVTTSYREPIIGYVVSEANDWTTLLRERDRKIVSIRSDSISRREVCRVENSQSQTVTIYDLIGERDPDYSKCPTED